MSKKVTIRDVAYISGVSISTVSRVVSGKLNVSKTTLQKVQDAIEKTGYQPNSTARALATNSTDTIAVIIDRSPAQGFGNSFFLEALGGIADKLSEYRKDMVLVFETEIEKGLDEVVKRLINSKKIDAAIKLTVQKNDHTLEYLTSTNTPTCVVGRADNYNVLTVNNDNRYSMQIATNHLIKQGASRIAFVGGNPEYIVTLDRQEGFIDALKENSIEFKNSDMYHIDFSIEAGQEIADTLIQKDYDAVACTDDLIAYGIAKRYHELGKTIKLVGFNNTYLSEMSNIPFTSVDINSRKLGEKAVELLFNGFIEDEHLLVDTKLIIRS